VDVAGAGPHLPRAEAEFAGAGSDLGSGLPDARGWCAEPIEIGVPGFVLRPPVLRRTAVPLVTDLEEAARRPELGVLSVMSHGDTEQGTTIAAAVLPAIQGLDDDRVRLYYDLGTIP